MSRQPKHQHCNSRSRDATTGPGRCAVGAVNIQSQKKTNQKVCLRVGSFSLSEGVFMQRCNVKTKKNPICTVLGCLHICTLSCKTKDTCTSKNTQNEAGQFSQNVNCVFQKHSSTASPV